MPVFARVIHHAQTPRRTANHPAAYFRAGTSILLHAIKEALQILAMAKITAHVIKSKALKN
jgi:hypothetical protein